MNERRDAAEVSQHVALAGALTRWIERAGVEENATVGDLAVGLADILHAARAAQRHLDALLALDPTTAQGADAALDELGHLHALYVTEILDHARDLEARWPLLESALESRASAE